MEQPAFMLLVSVPFQTNWGFENWNGPHPCQGILQLFSGIMMFQCPGTREFTSINTANLSYLSSPSICILYFHVTDFSSANGGKASSELPAPMTLESFFFFFFIQNDWAQLSWLGVCGGRAIYHQHQCWIMVGASSPEQQRSNLVIQSPHRKSRRLLIVVTLFPMQM